MYVGVGGLCTIWYKLCVGVAYMRYMRDVNASMLTDSSDALLAVYLLSDASEQGGVDWQLTHEIMIAGKDLIPLFDAVDELLLIRTN